VTDLITCRHGCDGDCYENDSDACTSLCHLTFGPTGGYEEVSRKDELIAFLHACLDEDQAAAESGETACWHVDYCNETGPVFHERFTPARVLAEVKAKRRILAELMPVIEELDDIAYSEGQGPMPYKEPPSLLLKLLALPYADRPGYLPEWAPEEQP
jgi:hypothetical protein